MSDEQYKKFTYRFAAIHFAFCLLLFIAYIWDPQLGFQKGLHYLNEAPTELAPLAAFLLSLILSVIFLKLQKYKAALISVLLPEIIFTLNIAIYAVLNLLV